VSIRRKFSAVGAVGAIGAVGEFGDVVLSAVKLKPAP
jgi:hypothetical protein